MCEKNSNNSNYWNRLPVSGSPETHLESLYKGQKVLSSEKRLNSMDSILVSEQDIIDTYSKEEQVSCQKYQEYVKLIKTNPGFGCTHCAKLLNVKPGQLRWWHSPKVKAIPLPLKTVEKLKTAGLLPLTVSHQHIEEILRMLGVLFGDGNIDIRLNTMAFISSKLEDIELWRENLIKLFPFAKDKINMIEGGEYGHSFNIRIFDRSVIRLFVALGAPVGNKVSTIYTLPKYIFSVNENLKIAFLDGLIASEFSVPQWRAKTGYNYYFTNFALGLSKVSEMEENHLSFLQGLERLCNSIGIDTTLHIRKDINKSTPRTDGKITHCYRIFFQTHFHKVLYFDKIFPLVYAQDKKRRMQEQIEIALEFKERKSLRLNA